MCRGCDDFREFAAAINAYIARELPKMMAQPLDTAVILRAGSATTEGEGR